MAVIAVAGGMGQVGRAIVDGLVQHGHKVIVLSRKTSENSTGFTVVAADYDDVDDTAKLLQDNNVGILMCAIGVLNEKSNRSQLNLIKAASQSSCTHRFVIGSYDMKHLREHIEINPLAKYTFQAIDALEKTDLEYTQVVNGWFLDYYGMPHWKSSLHPWINILNMEQKWAVIPGDGTASATFITTQDLGRFLGRLMDAATWDKESTIVGNEIQFNELLKLAEEIRGCKFEVACDSLQKLDAGSISFSDRFPKAGLGSAVEDQAFFARIHYLAGSGNYAVAHVRRTLNEQFPDIKLTTCDEVMRTAWQGRV